VRQAIGNINTGGREVLAMDLDSVLLASAAKSLLATGDNDDEAAGKLMSGLKSIQIRAFEIESPAAYRTRVQPIRDVLKGSQWARYATYASGQDDMELWSGRWGNEPTGVLLLSVTGKQVFIMHVVGNLRPDQLLSLSGQLGIPMFYLPLGPFRFQ
jgi:hypothetical protein